LKQVRKAQNYSFEMQSKKKKVFPPFANTDPKYIDSYYMCDSKARAEKKKALGVKYPLASWPSLLGPLFGTNILMLLH